MGIGTVITALGIGALFNLTFAALHFPASEARQENLFETLCRLRSGV